MRKCNQCEKTFPMEMFYKNKGSIGGRRGECRRCHDANVKARRNPVLWAIRKTIWRSDNPLKKKYFYPERSKKSIKKWRKDNPHKTLAHKLVHKAIKRGELVRPNICAKCGKSGRIEASHTSYSKPLDIEWLCTSCHRRKDIGKWINLIAN